MNNSSELSLRAQRMLFFAGLLVVLICAYIFVSAIITTETTGTISIDTSDSKAIISISQVNHQAKNVGNGKVKVRLKPGNYQIIADDGNAQAGTTVSIKKKQVVKTILTLKKTPKLPSVDDIDFKNIDALTDRGLTTSQINTLELDFFQYKTTTQSAIINIGGIQSVTLSQDPSSLYTLFGIIFDVTIDGKLVHAEINYSGLDTIRLYLRDPTTNAVLFDSYTVASTQFVD